MSTLKIGRSIFEVNIAPFIGGQLMMLTKPKPACESGCKCRQIWRKGKILSLKLSGNNLTVELDWVVRKQKGIFIPDPKHPTSFDIRVDRVLESCDMYSLRLGTEEHDLEFAYWFLESDHPHLIKTPDDVTGGFIEDTQFACVG